MGRLMVLALVLAGCRYGDRKAGVDTQSLEAIGDVDAMAEAWCQLISCQPTFDDSYDSIEACVALHEDYWGNPAWENNRRACFTDIEATDACIAALEQTPCGDRPPDACTDLLACALPNDFGR